MADIQKTTLDSQLLVNDILSTIDRDREREIVSRRFGLFDRKETLEQIGELLGVTRERIRQLEKAITVRLKSEAEQGRIPHISETQELLTTYLEANGTVARVTTLSAVLTEQDSRQDRSRLAFLATLCPELDVVDEDDNFYQSVTISKTRTQKKVKSDVKTVIDAIKDLGNPETIAVIAKKAKISDAKQAEALASVSKNLATLNDYWGLAKWPTVNPKNIRDKIYVILKENGKHMHFSDIAKAIKDSDFKRKDVTTQAIHNELIKDKRFVLVGRGIYALKEWGYKKGTVADIIADILKKEGAALHRDEIVKRVLKSRYVKETTILLNLQGKPQFKRVAKATYNLADSAE